MGSVITSFERQELTEAKVELLWLKVIGDTGTGLSVKQQIELIQEEIARHKELANQIPEPGNYCKKLTVGTLVAIIAAVLVYLIVVA